MDLMQRFTDNLDDISPKEYEIISNHLDTTVDMERDNGEFPLHTHLLSIHLHFYTSSIFLSKINTLILLKPDFYHVYHYYPISQSQQDNAKGTFVSSNTMLITYFVFTFH